MEYCERGDIAAGGRCRDIVSFEFVQQLAQAVDLFVVETCRWFKSFACR
jgi:hypothetical protein